jgi:hypothetical protein
MFIFLFIFMLNGLYFLSIGMYVMRNKYYSGICALRDGRIWLIFGRDKTPLQ